MKAVTPWCPHFSDSFQLQKVVFSKYTVTSLSITCYPGYGHGWVTRIPGWTRKTSVTQDFHSHDRKQLMPAILPAEGARRAWLAPFWHSLDGIRSDNTGRMPDPEPRDTGGPEPWAPQLWPLDWTFVLAPDRRIGSLSPTFKNMQDRGHRWQRLGVKGDLLCMQIVLSSSRSKRELERDRGLQRSKFSVKA